MFYSQFRKWKFPDRCDTHQCHSRWNFSRFEPVLFRVCKARNTKSFSAAAVFLWLQPLDWPAKCENLTSCVKNTISLGCFEGSSYRFGNKTTFPTALRSSMSCKKDTSAGGWCCYCCLNLFPSVFSFYNKLSYPANWLVVFSCVHMWVWYLSSRLNSEKEVVYSPKQNYSFEFLCNM